MLPTDATTRGAPSEHQTTLTDVFCTHHLRFLPTLALPVRNRFVLFGLAWVAATAAFVAAAYLTARGPILAVAVAAGAALLYLPLRHLPVVRRLGAVLWFWAVAVVAVNMVTKQGGRVINAVSVVLLAITLIVMMGALSQADYSDVNTGEVQKKPSSLPVPPRAASWVAILIAAGLAVWLVDGVLAMLGSTQLFPAGWRATTELTLTGTSLVLAALALAVVVGAVEGTREVARQTDEKKLKVSSAVFGPLAIVSRVVDRILLWLGNSSVAALNTMRLAATVMFSALWSVVRLLIVPAAGLLLAGWLAWHFAGSTASYLTAGSLASLAAAFGAAGGMTMVLLLVCLALAGPSRTVGLSLIATACIAAAYTAVAMALTGWAIGIWGTFAHGPIQVGWVTIALTAVLVTTAIINAVYRHTQPVNFATRAANVGGPTSRPAHGR